MIFFLVLSHLGCSWRWSGKTFIRPLPMIGARVLLMPIIMFYGALALPIRGMLALCVYGGLMWDARHAQFITDSGCRALHDGYVEIALGWSIILYAVLGSYHERFSSALPTRTLGNPLSVERHAALQ